MDRKVYWTRQARDDLRAIRDHIARDAPATAAAFVRRLRMSVDRLGEFPLSGQVKPIFTGIYAGKPMGFFRLVRFRCALLASRDFVRLLAPIVPVLVPRVPPSHALSFSTERLNAELASQFQESCRLEKAIRDNLASIGFALPEVS